jgi:hypothetical protein
MTFLTNSSVARPAKVAHDSARQQGLKLIDELRAEIRSGMATG